MDSHLIGVHRYEDSPSYKDIGAGITALIDEDNNINIPDPCIIDSGGSGDFGGGGASSDF